MNISFSSEIAEFQLDNEDIYREWLIRVIENEDKKLGEISFKFVNDTTILEINRKYLNHDYLTDIISFDDSFNNTLNGDIYICIDIVKSNALEHSKGDFTYELRRNLVHGLLHLIGYKDGTDLEKKSMREYEDTYLAYLDEF